MAIETIIEHCKVPWCISSTTSGLTLQHSESDVAPECTVSLGGGRLIDGLLDSRRIDIEFPECYYSRTGFHSDSEGIECLGYENLSSYKGDMGEYLNWHTNQWANTGTCPDSGFYVATKSEWLSSLPSHFKSKYNHYIIDGRDSYLELIASKFKWQEWLWPSGDRDKLSINKAEFTSTFNIA